jgi:hypothetical protein
MNNTLRERSTKELELNIKLPLCVYCLILLKLHQRRHLVLPSEIKQWAGLKNEAKGIQKVDLGHTQL